MDFKDLLLLLKTGSGGRGALELGLAMARTHAASLTALCLCGEPTPTIAEGFAIGPRAVGAVIKRLDAEVAAAVAPVGAAFRAKVAELGLDGAWESPVMEPLAEDVALFARAFDLAIVGRGADDRALAEQIVLLGGTPCMVVGEGERAPVAFDRVVVAWDASRPAKRAVQDALPILARARTVRLVGVGRTVDPRPHAGQVAILRHLRRHGVEAAFARVEHQGVSTGAALLREGGRFEADLLVLGAYGHCLLAEAIFGGTTRTVLAQAALPILISH